MVVAAVGSGRTRPSANRTRTPKRPTPGPTPTTGRPGRSKTPGRHRRKPGASTMFRVSTGSQSGGDRGQAEAVSQSTARASRAPRTASTAGARTRRGADRPATRRNGCVRTAANHRGDPRSGARGLSPAEPEPLSDRARQHLGPQSQSLFRSYGSNLPTSLTYISLSTRGSSPWRPAADMGTSQIGCSP